MRLLSSAVLMFAVLAFVACSTPPAEEVVVEEPDTTEADLAAIQELVDAWSTMFDLQNPDPYLALFTDDAQFLWPETATIEGKAAIREWTLDNFLDGEVTYVSEERKVLGDFAYDLGTVVFLPTPEEGEEQRTLTGRYLLFAGRQVDGSWKLTRYLWQFAPPTEG
jgi:uncharacterized protein (TIGR02246 family)